MADALVLGATSMVGSHFVRYGGHPVAAAGRRDPHSVGITVERFVPVDLEKPDRVREVVRDSAEPVVINFAAATDVDAIETERPESGSAVGSGPAWSLNALAPEAAATGARESGKFLIQISTDFVFDGQDGPYAEGAARSPLSPRMSWYGWTKSEGERRAVAANPACAIVRISYPFRTDFPAKLDFARRILSRYREADLPPMYADQLITPTWVPDVTAALAELLRRRSPGVLHVASPDRVTPLEFATALVSGAEGRAVELARGTLGDTITDGRRAPRPLHGGLRTVRATEMGRSWTTWRSGLEQLLRAEGPGS